MLCGEDELCRFSDMHNDVINNGVHTENECALCAKQTRPQPSGCIRHVQRLRLAIRRQARRPVAAKTAIERSCMRVSCGPPIRAIHNCQQIDIDAGQPCKIT